MNKTTERLIKILKESGKDGISAYELAKKMGYNGDGNFRNAGYDYIYNAKNDEPKLGSKISKRWFSEDDEYRYIITGYNKEELYDSIAKTSDLLKEEIKKPTEGKEVILETDEPVLLVIMSDLHLGHEYACYKEIKECSKLISKYPNVYVIGLGDLIDNSTNAHAPSGAINLGGKEVQTKMIEHIFEILDDSILRLYVGNHELRSQKSDDFMPNKFWALKYDASFGFYAFPFIIEVGDKKWCFFMRHKAKGNSQYSPLHACVRSVLFDSAEYSMDADVIVTAHTHESGYGKWKVGGKERMMLSAASMVDFDDYAERTGYVTGVDKKFPAIYLTENEEEAEMFLDFKQAISKYEDELK